MGTGTARSGDESKRAELKEKLTRLVAAGDTAAVLELMEQLAAGNDKLASRNDELSEQVRRRDVTIKHYQRLLFGRRSEKLTTEELGQLVLAYGGTDEDAKASEPSIPVPEHEDVEPEESEAKPNKRKHPGRTALSPDLERVVHEVPVPADERCCLHCEQPMTSMGFVVHERLEYVPAKLVVHEERREKLGCTTTGCKADATTAPRTMSSPLPTRVGASLLTLLIERKCDDALPIHRQCDQLARLGWEVPVSTLYGYWKYATDMLLPVADALLGTVLADPCYVAMDDTGLDVLDRNRKNGKYRGHLWCFRGTLPLIAFAFTETWKAEEIAPWVHAIPPDTHIQVDDYGGYSHLVVDADGKKKSLVPKERRLGCMMHVRRRFHAALKLGDKRAAVPMGLFKALYKIEKKARGMSPEDRHEVRNKESLPLLEQLYQWIDAHAGRVGKSGKLAEAIRYALNQKQYVERCFSDGRFEIDNGAVERSIRKPAVGRKNFLFTGSADAARRLAAAYTLVLSCRELGISTREYLIDIIEKIEGGWPMRRLVELLPHRWAAARQLPVEAA